MKYGDYKKKMQAVSKVLNVLNVLKFPILGVVVAGITTSLVLTSLNGKADKVQMSETEIPYGTPVNAIGSSIFGDAEVEYSEYKKNNWTSEVPTYVGKYEVRAVSTNGFGQKTYSAPVAFDILPKPLEINFTPTSITYGTEITYTHNLEVGERISNFTTTYGDNYYEKDPFGDKETFVTEISFDASTIKIYNDLEEDITSCYSIEPTKHPLTIKKRDLNIIYKESSKIYDGTSLGTNLHFVSDETPLADGDSFQYKESKEIVDPGILDITKDYEIIGSSGGKSLDRTAFYNVTFNTPELTILKREVTLSTNTIDTTYNGYAFSSDPATATEGRLLTYNLAGELAEGHELVVSEFASEGLFKPLTGGTNSVDYAILDSTGEDVTEKYYTVKEEFGSVNVAKHEITLTLYDDTKEYDGAELRGGYSVTEMPLTDTLKAELSETSGAESITDIGTTTYSYDFTIQHEEFGDVTDCYSISYKDNKTSGVLTIKEVPLLLKSNNTSKTYDGIPFSDEGEGNSRLSVEDVNNRLLEGHKLITTFDHDEQRFVNDLNRFTYDIVDETSGESVLHFYDISTEFGIITTTKRQMTISYANKEAGSNGNYSFVYDGTSKTANYEITSPYEGEEPLAKDDIINFTSEMKTITNVGKIDNFDDEHTYEITYLDQDVSAYYDITLIDASVEITQRVIKVKLNSLLQDKMYDGKAIEIPENYVEFYCEDGFEIEDKFKINYVFPQTSFFRAGTYPIEMNVSISLPDGSAVDEDGFRIEDNFVFEYENNGKTSVVSSGSDIELQTLKISKRPLTLSTYNATKVYDGTDLDSYDAANENGATNIWKIDDATGLAEGDSVTVSQYTSITDVGSAQNSITYDIYNSNLESVIDCYDVKLNKGNLEITKADINISYNGQSVYTYNNTYYSPDANNFTATGLAPNHSLVITTSSKKDAGTYNFKDLYSYKIRDINGSDVTSNYNTVSIEVPEYFVIDKREANIYFKELAVDLNFAFTDDVYSVIDFDAGTNFNSATNESVTINWATTAKEDVENNQFPGVVVKYHFYSSTGTSTETTKNYKINIFAGTIEHGITKIDVKIACGEEYETGENIKPKPRYSTTSLPSGYYFGEVEYKEQTCIEDKDYLFEVTSQVKIYNDKGQDVTNFFEFTSVQTTFTFTIQKYQLDIDTINKEINFDNEGHYIFVNSEDEAFLEDRDHHIEVVNQDPIKLPGSKTYIIDGPEDIVVKNANGEDVTKLYKVVVTDNVKEQGSTVKIHGLNIEITTPDISKTFDGDYLDDDDAKLKLTRMRIRNSNNNFLVLNERLQKNRNENNDFKYLGLTFRVSYPILDYRSLGYHAFGESAGKEKVDNVCDFEILDEKGNKIQYTQDQFSVSYTYGSIEIKPLVIRYDTLNYQKNYDGNDIVTSEDLMSGGKNIVKVNLGSLPAKIRNGMTSFSVMLDANGNLFMAHEYTNLPNFVLVYEGVDLVAHGDIVFEGGYVTQTINRVTLNISNLGGSFKISSRDPQAPEQIYAAGLVEGDVLYVGNELWEESILDYSAIPNMDYGTPEGYVYSNHVDASIFRVERSVYGQNVTVTSCYNIHFHWNEVIVKTRG